MKKVVEARHLDSGAIEPRHEIEVLCSNCNDPVSDVEAATGNCTNCGQPWQPKQHVRIWATSVPEAGGGVM